MSGLHADLPMYAAPLTTTGRPAPTRATTLVDTWVPYGRIIARDHPWFDRAERAVNELRLTSHRYQVRVTATNAPICLRVALPADELMTALWRVAGRGAIEIGDCRLSLDPGSRHTGDEKGIDVISGSLSMPWMCGRLDVVAAARPWSSTRADLVLSPARHRLRYPRRWFAVGFALGDELRQRLTDYSALGAGGR
ncbi:MAG: hypothetical protein ABIQ73_11040 [Acidimicrobiales bacterium]